MVPNMWKGAFLLFVVVPPGDAFAQTNITCGSAIKLVHQESSFMLHSHDINYGSGSKQQSVTAHGNADDSGNLWVIKESHDEEACIIGQPIACGSTVRSCWHGTFHMSFLTLELVACTPDTT